MSYLDECIDKTEDILEEYDLMPHDPSPDEQMMRNQIEIMRTLKEIQNELRSD